MAKFIMRRNINEEERRTDFLEVFEKIKNNPVPARRPFSESIYLRNDRRYYISDKKYYIFDEKYYRDRCGETVKYEDYLGIELIEVSSKNVIGLDLLLLCRKFKAYFREHFYEDYTEITAESNSIINQHVCDIIKRVKPYITNKELVDLFAEFVGNRYLYFDIKEYRTKNSVGQLTQREIVNAYFVDSIVRPH